MPNHQLPAASYNGAGALGQSWFMIGLDLLHSIIQQKCRVCGVNATQAILYHPSGLNCPSIPTIKTRAKISYLASIITSPDHLLHELRFLINDTNSSKHKLVSHKNHSPSFKQQKPRSKIFQRQRNWLRLEGPWLKREKE